MNKSEFGVLGIGVMGKSIAVNCLEKGYSLSVYNREEGEEKEVVNKFLANNTKYKNLQGYNNLKQFSNSLNKPRRLLIMVNAGAAVDSVIDSLLSFLEPGDVIIDGGNSHYLDTKRRNKYLKEKQIDFIGAGISGGEEGARLGPSIMPSGSLEGYLKVSSILESLAALDINGLPCCTYLGEEGSGHFVKMVHNGIEYAEMQLLAELVFAMRISMTYNDIALVFKSWQETEDSSYLLEITTKILEHKEGDIHLLDVILDKAGNKGTGSWSTIEALQLGIPNTMMSQAVFARYISAFKKTRTALSNKIKSNKKHDVSSLKLKSYQKSYRFARLINHHQGFDLLLKASKEYNWELKLSEIARIWTNGCIIKSDLMIACSSELKEGNSLINKPEFIEYLSCSEPEIIEFIQYGVSTRTPIPCFYSAYNYWISMTTEKLSANIIQAQRDYFGSHKYQRVDKPNEHYFHTEW